MNAVKWLESIYECKYSHCVDSRVRVCTFGPAGRPYVQAGDTLLRRVRHYFALHTWDASVLVRE
jgi:hypothetical protein